MRIATIDIGTNTVLLLVAERDARGVLLPLTERATITRLGEGVDRTKQLSPAAVERTAACIDEYANVIRDAGARRIAVVGTSAMRDAAGSEQLRARVRAALGVEPRVLSGEDEARLTFRGALSGLPLDVGGDLTVFDIGGGSTEVVIGQRGEPPTVQFARSFDVGSVRLTERHCAHDPPSPEEREAICRAARDAFAEVPHPPGAQAPIGIAGTMTTLGAVSLSLVPYDGELLHGQVMLRTEIASVLDRLANMDLNARRNVAGMEPKRADVIVAGGLIALALLDHWGARSVRVSDRGVRWGLAEELAE
jgi:exopolyphosphatase/guanosine-5'-triphosphate,3'-diphosphate pyrophosphatase